MYGGTVGSDSFSAVPGAGRPFKLVTDCSVLTWLFRSRNLHRKQYRWSVRLAEFDMAVGWRDESAHHPPLCTVASAPTGSCGRTLRRLIPR